MSSLIAGLLLFLTIVLYSQADGDYVYTTNYLNMKVDHFSSQNYDTFPMKYLLNDTYWEPKYGPIFFLVGSEAPIEMLCESAGFMWEIAEAFKAMVVCAEHRYYGTSIPYDIKLYQHENLKLLRYLTIKQAMADFVSLIRHLQHNVIADRRLQHIMWNNIDPFSLLNQEEIQSHMNPVIAFGGSYAGMLAAWLRIKYPLSVEGAIASSAPIWGFNGMTTPCNEYLKITSSVFADASVECSQTISASWKAIDNVTETADGKRWLMENWKLCDPLINHSDVLQLKRWNTVLYVYSAMANNPYPTKKLPENPVREMCKFMNNHKEDDLTLLVSVFNGINVFFNYTGTIKCTDIYSSFLSIPELDQMGWLYQTCTEIIFPMCANGINDIFESKEWSVKKHTEACFNIFGVRPNYDEITDYMYNAKNLSFASNIIFSNGLMDPWSSNGVLENISETVRAVIIPEGAHCLDLWASNVKDPYSVVKARETHKEWIRKWILNYQKRHLSF